MFHRTAIALLALVGLTICSTAARAQFGPAIPPPSGPVPTGPSTFPPITIPAPPPGWMGTGTNPAPTSTPHHVYKIYYRVSSESSWRLYTTANGRSDAEFMAGCLRAKGYEVFVQLP
jgi:hypothetical protein